MNSDLETKLSCNLHTLMESEIKFNNLVQEDEI